MNSNPKDNLSPHLPDPTEAEVTEQIKQAESEYGVRLSGAEAVRYTKLKRELGWWLTLDELATGPHAVTKEKAGKMRELVREQTGHELTLEEAGEQLRAISTTTSKHEKDRIASEIRVIIGR